MASPPPPGAPYADPNQQYQSQQYPQGPADPYQQQQPPAQWYPSQQQGFGAPPGAPGAGAPPPPGGAAPSGRGKRRGYAEQSYEFGMGANAALTPAVGGGAYSGPSQVPGAPPAVYGQEQYQQPQFVSPMGMQQPTYGSPSPGAMGGYDPVGGMTQQFGQMGMGGQAPMHPAPQMMPQPLGNQQAQGLNPLVTVDLMHTPFNAAELDLAPPSIILPPNAALTPSPNANCPPQYMRSTINAVPATNSLLKRSKLPFALIIQPYTSLHDAEDPVPLVSDTVISRCRRCRSYINPFATFLDHGNRWRCNMCNLTNDVPQAFDWDAQTQKTVDRWQRAELNYSVVEFIAPQEYMVRPPQPLVYLFVLDVSFAAVQSGLLATAARTILESLDRIPNADKRTRLGFLCVDSSLHYFSISRETNEPSMMVVSDLEEPFLPIPGDLLDMFQNTQNSGSCMGSALQAGHKIISAIGGKMVVLTASLPNVGAGKLEMREDKKVLGTSKENTLLQTANSFYKSFAVECSKNQVSVDMFLFANGYQDVASLSNLPRYTGGQTWHYPGWNASRSEDAIKFAREFSDHLSAEIALEAVMRVRATTGLRMQTFYGNFFKPFLRPLRFPSAFPRDQGYVVEVAIDETLGNKFVCMQTAVLHTTCNGERRIRVMTLALPTTQNIADLYASADQVAITTYYAHKAVEKSLSGGLEAAREALQSKIQELLITYKKECTASHMGGASPLSFAANLRGLVVLFLALMKHVGLRKSSQIPTDLRSAALALLSTLPAPPHAVHLPPPLLPSRYARQLWSSATLRSLPHRRRPDSVPLDRSQAVPQLIEDVFRSTRHQPPQAETISRRRLELSPFPTCILLWAMTMLIEDRADGSIGLTQFWDL
ncbi:hypothetical protein BZA77DRAFT_330803 [Pyronema omphalodes]|nr:hypothetical protein BZA77DRAFT_330803 [Pyronema omphalodes]